MDPYDDAIGYHEREEMRLTKRMYSWRSILTGSVDGYAEAAYAHKAALIHLRKVHEYQAPKDETAPMEAGSGHNFERDMAPPDPMGEEPWQFGFRA